MYDVIRIDAVFDPGTPVERVIRGYREAKVPVTEVREIRERATVDAIRKATGVRVVKHRDGTYGRKRERKGGAQSFRITPVVVMVA